MTHKNTKPDNRGFTLSEVLIAVAILIVLMGLAMIPIARHQRDCARRSWTPRPRRSIRPPRTAFPSCWPAAASATAAPPTPSP